MHPDDPNYTFNEGIRCLSLGDYVTAEYYFRQTLILAPESIEAQLNLGYVLDQLERPEEALDCYNSILTVSPQHPKARYNRAAHLLRSGNLSDGFADYESRFAAIPGSDNRSYAQPRWDGSPLHDRSILVYCEQGLGDALMFARYLPLLARYGARVILETQEPLITLLESVEGVSRVEPKSVSPPASDVYIPLLSLPLMFHTTLDSIPARVPYLSPPDELVATWQTRLKPSPGTLNVGLVWAGKTHPYPNRTCPPEYLAPLLALPGICFYSLQVGEQEHSRLPRESAGSVIDLTGDIRDFADSAALVGNLDLVITIDTAMAHLAGALGKPVWVMLSADADWRWLQNRNDSPWYPTMMLFRQPKAGDWHAVIREITDMLRNILPNKGLEKAVATDMTERSFKLALTALDSNNPEAAIPILDTLAQTMPEELAVWFHLGRAYEWAGKTADAETALQRAHQLKPESVDVLLHLGAALVRQNKVDEAFECCRKMLALQPDNAVARYNLAFLQLRTGDYRAGFANFEARLSIESFAVDTRRYPQPRWDGAPLNGKSILVFGEQGMGDVIQFIRYIPLVAARGGKVILEVDPPLIPLFKDFPGTAQVVAKTKTPPSTDLYIQLLSLPYIFGTTVETVPAHEPYIVPVQAKVDQWRNILGNGSTFKIGLVWRGNPNNPRDKERSCPLTTFAGLADLPSITFYSLQVGTASVEASTPPPPMHLVDLSEQLTDFTETAALMAHLDLVIAVDTAVAHLAAAMGKPVWVLLPAEADWRWLQGHSDSPWYASMRVFEQVRNGGWPEMMARVKATLEELLAKNNADPASSDIEVCYERGALLKEKGDLAGAERCFRQIVEQAPDLPDPQHSLGVVLHLQGRIVEAIDHYRIATTLDPVFVKAHYNLANACQQSGRYQDAIEAARTVLAIDPLHANAHWLLGALLLRQGEFDAGWQEYEWRWQADGFTSRIPDLGRPLWDGSPLTGKTLLIHMEQGRGDMIQFIRYAPLAAALGGRIVVCALPELVPLLATVEGVDLVVDRNGPLPEFDLHIPVQSLPHRLGTTMATIPATVPYLNAPPAYRAKWSGRSTTASSCMRIGLVWEGNKMPDVERSYPPELLTPLLELPNTAFYSLQVGSRHSVGRIIDYSAELSDFADTAALIETLDLVISIDTAVAHLSGALGKPVWTLLPFVSDWRWLRDRDDTPWYPSMRLFRQSSLGDWSGVMSTVLQALQQLLAENCISGIDLLRSGDAAGAERQFAEMAAQQPDNAETHCNRGVALDALGRYEEAIACYQTALSLKPDYMQAVYNMGNAWMSLAKPDYAQRCFEYALELSPDLVTAHLALGEIGKSRHDFDLAHKHFQAALLLEPASADALQGEAETLHTEERFREAIIAYRQALAVDPGRVAALNMMGSAYQCLEELETAEECYRQVLSLEPERSIALNNLGVVLNAQGRHDEAVCVLRHLRQLHPGYAEGRWNLSVALLAAGLYAEGWQEFEWRFKKASPVPQPMFKQPRWDGSPLDGRTILLHAEQGFGDTIQFVRYAPLVARLGGRVIIECQIPELKRLLLSLEGVAQVIVSGEPLPYFDCHLPMMSLPLIFGTSAETIPAQIPYLCAEHADVETWRHRLKPSAKFRVGVVWHAKQSQVLNRKRSCPLRMLAPLWSVPDVEFYSLQIGDGSAQLEEFRSEYEIHDLTQQINDFADTAAFMSNLDLVITIDTVTAHLAGALGAPTWVVLPHVAEWRWLQNRSDTPWYPGMRLFRQPARGDWAALMNSVAGSLHDVVQSHRSGGASLPGIHRQAATQHNAARPPGGIRVGLAWYGRQDTPLNRKRSCPFSALAPLFDLPDITFVNLQLEAPNDLDTRLLDLTGDIRNFEDTAALMANLDLIISIDTSVAHLAAASGRATWVLLSHVADWRWLAEGDITPWYPAVHLFRQPDHGDWAAVVREVAYRLTQLSAGQLNWNRNGDNSMPSPDQRLERQFLEQQLERHQETMCLNPADPDAQLDVGVSLALLGRHDEAIVSFRHVLELDSEHNAAHLNLAYSLLTMGTYDEGWQHLEWRLRRIPAGQLPPWPMLRREQLDSHSSNASVLVHCEQGYGDTIQFARFLPLLADAGFRIIVSCQPPILPLIASIQGVSQVVPHGELLPVCDFQILMLSLAGLFAVEFDQVPAPIPYLTSQPCLVERWKQKLDTQLKNE